MRVLGSFLRDDLWFWGYFGGQRDCGSRSMRILEWCRERFEVRKIPSAGFFERYNEFIWGGQVLEF